MTLPTISFIVPVYRASGEQLRRCLLSIAHGVNQESYEIIVVPDGKDQMPDMDVSFLDSTHVRVVEQDHRGVSAARNVGILAARGIWLAFVDADDTVEPRVYSELMCAAQGESEIDLVVANHVRRYGHKEILIRNFVQPMHLWKPEDYLRIVLKPSSDGGTVWGSLFRRATVQSMSNLFSEELVNGEDIEFMIRYLAVCNTIKSLDIVSYIYIVNANSVVHSFDVDYLRKTVATLNLISHDLSRDFSAYSTQKLFYDFVLDRFLSCLRNYVFNFSHKSGMRRRFDVLRNEAYMQNAFVHSWQGSFGGIKDIVLLLAKYRIYMPLKLIYRAESIARKRK